MPTVKPGHRQIRTILEEGSEVETTLLEWAKKRGLTPGTANRCILVDWAEAMNGQINPFAMAIAAAAGVQMSAIPAGINASSPLSEGAQAPELSPEERARQQALAAAAEQFLDM